MIIEFHRFISDTYIQTEGQNLFDNLFCFSSRINEDFKINLKLQKQMDFTSNSILLRLLKEVFDCNLKGTEMLDGTYPDTIKEPCEYTGRSVRPTKKITRELTLSKYGYNTYSHSLPGLHRGKIYIKKGGKGYRKIVF